MLKRLALLLLIGLLALPGGLYAQGSPPQELYDALDDLSRRVGVTLTLGDLRAWNWEQAAYPDASLGCPQPDQDYAQVVTVGYRFVFNYEGATYDYRAARDSDVLFLCSGPPTAPTVSTTPTARPSTPTPDDTGPANTGTGRSVCAGAMDTQLATGVPARARDNGIPKNVRSQPGVGSAQVGQVPAGALVQIVGGPQCADGMVWWQINMNGLIGWVAEGQYGVYWFSPAETTSAAPVTGSGDSSAPAPQPDYPGIPAQPQPITADNAAALVRFVDLPLDEAITGLGWSPDGQTLGATGQAGIWLYNVADLNRGQPPRLLQIPNGPVNDIAFSSDQATMATAHADGTVRIWDIETGGQRAVLRGPDEPVLSVAFNPDSTLLAAAGGSESDYAVRLWDIAGQSPSTVLEGHSAPVNTLTFSADGTLLASGGEDTTVRLWDVVSGTPALVLEGHSAPALALTFSVDGAQLASAGADGMIMLWDIASGSAVTLPGHTDAITSLALTPGGSLLASGGGTLPDPADNTIRLWNTATSEPIAFVENYGTTPTIAVQELVFNPAGTLLAFATTDGQTSTVRVWGVAP
jgi:WD40 repeat protein